jgi:hypothetical protein
MGETLARRCRRSLFFPIPPKLKDAASKARAADDGGGASRCVLALIVGAVSGAAAADLGSTVASRQRHRGVDATWWACHGGAAAHGDPLWWMWSLHRSGPIWAWVGHGSGAVSGTWLAQQRWWLVGMGDSSSEPMLASRWWPICLSPSTVRLAVTLSFLL